MFPFPVFTEPSGSLARIRSLMHAEIVAPRAGSGYTPRVMKPVATCVEMMISGLMLVVLLAMSAPQPALAQASGVDTRAPTGARAAEIAAADRPTIALVLSGGGAKGAAHVGVIEILEDLRVPVDMVIGTSMGAIVGGMYAAGYSPEDMARMLEETDWRSVFSDRPALPEQSFRQKQAQEE